MSGLDDRIAALAATARAWRDPDHPARAEAVRQTLGHHPLYTAEAVAFALNQAMHAATEKALRRWIGDRFRCARARWDRSWSGRFSATSALTVTRLRSR